MSEVRSTTRTSTGTRARRPRDWGLVAPAVLSVVFVLFGVLDVVDAFRNDTGFAVGLTNFGIALALASRPRSGTRAARLLWVVPILCLLGVQVSALLRLTVIAG